MATTTSPCSGLKESRSPIGKPLPSVSLAPSLRSCLSGCGTGSQPPLGSPAWLLSQGTQRCYPWGVDLNGGIVPASSRAGSGRERADTGNVPGATQVGFVFLFLLPLLLPPCPLLPDWTPPFHPHLDHRSSPTLSLGSSISWGNAAAPGVGFRMASSSSAGARCPLYVTLLLGA